MRDTELIRISEKKCSVERGRKLGKKGDHRESGYDKDPFRLGKRKA